MTEPRCGLIALHGFLGRASDWDVPASFFPGAAWHAIDLWNVLGAPGVDDWDSAGHALEREVDAGVDLLDRPCFLVAYSFGARLALAVECLGSPSSAVRGVCLVSCHPGLADADADGRASRRAADETWARRILEAPEADIWRAWDAQPVLAISATPAARGGLPASRARLAGAMRTFSLAGQPDRRARLLAWHAPLLWVSGQNDARFTGLAKELEEAGTPAGFAVCPGAGHRVPWDNAPAFAAIVRLWIDRALAAADAARQ